MFKVISYGIRVYCHERYQKSGLQIPSVLSAGHKEQLPYQLHATAALL